MHIRNVKITCFDDAIAVKPSSEGRDLYPCTENMLFENMKIVYGVGISIGSVSPGFNYTCVRNITSRNIDFDYPLKAVYIKTNPGVNGTGEISNIVYENLTMRRPIWWAIYIGPQQ